MSQPLRTCLILNVMLLILREVPSIKPEQILFVSTTKNTSDANALRNEISIRSNPETTHDPERSINVHDIVLQNTTISTNSKENLQTLEPKTKTEEPRIHTTLSKFKSNLTVDRSPSSAVSASNSSNNATSTVSRTTFLLQKSTEPTFNSIKVFQYAANNTGTVKNSKDNATKHFDITQRRNLNLLRRQGKIIRYARSDDKNQVNESELQPEGYVYDINHCQYVDDRVLCGYDKNPQEPKKKEVVDLDDICRKHGDRIECGYVTGPYPDAYHPDPEKDKIAKINLANYYNNIARSGRTLNVSDTNDEAYDEVLRMGDAPTALQTEIVKLRRVISKLAAALPANTSFTSETDSTLNPTTYTTKKNSEPNLSLSELLKLSSQTSKLTLSHLMTTQKTTSKDFQYTTITNPKKCVEKGGRIFCPTL